MEASTSSMTAWSAISSISWGRKPMRRSLRALISPAVEGHLSHDEAQQRGLARPVGAHQADPHARLDVQTGAVEDAWVPKDLEMSVRCSIRRVGYQRRGGSGDSDSRADAPDCAARRGPAGPPVGIAGYNRSQKRLLLEGSTSPASAAAVRRRSMASSPSTP